MTRFLLLFFASFLLAAVVLQGSFSQIVASVSTYSQPQAASVITSTEEEVAVTNTIDTTLSQMSIEEKIGQLFIAGHWKEADYYHMSNLIRAYHLGGVILMGMDSEYIPEVPTWVAVWEAESTIPLMIATDQEGGAVSRFRTEEFELTAQPDIEDVAIALKVAKERGSELRDYGVNTNLAPVLERSVDPFAFLYDRTFRNPERISALGQAMIVGYRDTGVVAVPKHFPGHEDTPVDSHVELPILSVSSSTFAAHISDFKTVLQSSQPEALMTAHVLIPAIDPDYPATLSKIILNQHLRQNIGFKGVIMTDDMAMGAITNDYEPAEAALLSFQAGADMILMAATPNDVIPATERFRTAVLNGEISEKRLDQSVRRILELKEVYLVDEVH